MRTDVMDKTKDLRGKSDDQLSEQLGQLNREAFNLRFQTATGQLEKPTRVREVRRSIARIQTLQAERVSAVDTPAPKAKNSAVKKATAKKPVVKKAAAKKPAPKRAAKK